MKKFSYFMEKDSGVLGRFIRWRCFDEGGASEAGALTCSESPWCWRGGRTNVCGVTVSSRDDDKLDDLLARGRLSAPRRERIFEEVERRTRAGLSARSKYLILAGPIALAAALAFVLRPESAQRAGYASKGMYQSGIEIGCSGGELAHCPRGSKLIFHFDPLPAAGFLHAFAEPLEPGHERVWYYPTAANPPPRVELAQVEQTLDRGIFVGPEHAAGPYRVHVIFASTPLSRDELLGSSAPNVVASRVVEMVIVDP